MAKVRSDIIIHGSAGMLGKELAVRQQKNGDYVLAALTQHGKHERAKGEKAHRKRLYEVRICTDVTEDSPMADFYHPPEIDALDLSSYTGAVGEPITITAADNVVVKTVGVLIATDEGTVIEKGSAVRVPRNPNQWVYTATAATPARLVTILADVADIVGQVVELSQCT